MSNIAVGDLGFSLVKGKTSSNEAVFPHAIYKLTDSEFEKILKHSHGRIPEGYARINGEGFAYGEKAESKGTLIRRSGADRYAKGYYDKLLAILLGLLYERGGDVQFFGSHPPGDAEYGDDLIRAAVGKYHVEMTDKEMAFRVVMASDFDEPVGGVMNLILKANGQEYARTDIQGGRTLALDLGGHTFDMVSLTNGQVDYGIIESEKLGTAQVEKNFVRSLRSAYKSEFKGASVIPADRVRKAISTGVYEGGGRTYPCATEAREAANLLVNRIRDLYYEQAGGPQMWDNIVLTGGGSAMLYERLCNEVLAHDRVIPAESPEAMHLANVRGGMKLWKFYESEGMV